MSAYDFEIRYRPTGEHANVDGLSRLPIPLSRDEEDSLDATVFNISQMEALPVTTAQLRYHTRRDPLLGKIMRYAKGSWPNRTRADVRPFKHRANELSVEGECLFWGTTVVIPRKLQSKLMEELHRDHPGIVKMKAVARSYMWWPNIDKDLEALAKSCKECASVKRAPPKVPLHPWTWPQKPWQRAHLDFAGPFQGSMFFLAVDAYSKWPEVEVMTSTTTGKTLDVLRRWFSSHGLPEAVVTDNGPQFVSEEFEEFCKLNGIKHLRSAPYHPASNGLVERFV